MLIVVAPSSIAICSTSAVNSTSARVASIGENSTSSTNDFACATARARRALDVLARGLQLVLDVDVRRRDERVDPRSLGVAYRLGGTLDVGRLSARQAGDHGAVHLAGDRLDRLEVAGRGDREAGLDDVDAQPRELVRDLELLGRVQRDPGRLLAVAQGGVEDDDPVGVHGLLLCLPRGSFSSWYAASRPPRAIPPEGGGEEGDRGRGAAPSRATVSAARPLGQRV